MANKELYKTGQKAPAYARYAWDHYIDETYFPFPTIDELTIILKRGETFPPIKSRDKEAWWRISSYL